MIINIRVPIEPPPTHQAALRVLKNKKTGSMFIGKMKSSKSAMWRVKFELLLKQWKPEKPMGGVIRASINFAYPLLAKHKGKMMTEPKITRPDCDNLVKSVLDALTSSGYITDDSNVAILTVTKQHHYKAPYIDVIMTEEKNNPFLDNPQHEDIEHDDDGDN